jgi:hypothetical protein
MNKEFLNKEKASFIIKLLGVIQLTIGLFSLGIAPLEIYSFYLFSEGGRFYYEGFGPGSFLYALIFAQIIGYYFIAFLFISIGYGHLKLKLWVVKISKSCIWFWIIFGIPIMLFFFPLLTMKEFEVKYPILLSAFIILLFIIVIPGLLLAFYNQKNVKELFVHINNTEREIQNIPISGQLSLLVYTLYIMIFHIMIFFKGIFPFFGRFLIDFKGILSYDLCILFMFLLIYGLIKRKYWSWLLSVSFFVLMIISTVTTFINNQYAGIIELMEFPELENDIFLKLSVRSSHLLVATTLLFLLTIMVIIRAKSNFVKGKLNG